MVNSAVLDVALGLLFCYGSIAVISSSIYEAFASILKLRARTLLEGVKSLLNDESFTGLAWNLYNHALVNPRGDGQTPRETQPSTLPSYIDSKNFALALIDTIQSADVAAKSLPEKIAAIHDTQIRSLLEAMYARAGGDIAKVEDGLERWFDDSMDRVSGAYKRMSQLCTFGVGLIVVIALHIDTFRLVAGLWAHPAWIADMSSPNARDVGRALATLQTLPVGWSGAPPLGPATAVGWVVTAVSTLFGAPFWFDLLQRVTNLRGTGPKPNGQA